MGDYPMLGRNLDFSEILSKWGTADFKDAVVSLLELQEADLLLDELCEAGGGPDWDESAEFDLGDPQEHGKKIILAGDVWFKESIPTGCRDMNWREDRHGNIFRMGPSSATRNHTTWRTIDAPFHSAVP